MRLEKIWYLHRKKQGLLQHRCEEQARVLSSLQEEKVRLTRSLEGNQQQLTELTQATYIKK